MTTEGTGVRLGDLLTGAGLLKPADLREAMLIAKQQGLPVGRVLIMSAYLTEHQLQAAVRAQSMLKDGLIDQETVIKALALVGAEDLSLDDALKSLKWYQQEDVVTNKLGELLLEAEIVDKNQLQSALSQCETIGLPLGRVLVITSNLSEPMLTAALNAQVLVRDHKITREQAIQGLRSSKERQIPLEQYLAENGLLQLPTTETIRLGELLIETGVVDEPSVMGAVELGLINEKPIGQVLIEQNLIQEPLLENALEVQRMVAEANLKKSDAAQVLRLMHSKKRTFEEAVNDLHPAPPPKPTAPQPLPEPLPLYQFLQLAGLITPGDIETAVRLGSKDSQIMGRMLVHAEILAAPIVLIAQQSNDLICQGYLNTEQGIMALKTCQASDCSLDDVFSQLNWDKHPLESVRHLDKHHPVAAFEAAVSAASPPEETLAVAPHLVAAETSTESATPDVTTPSGWGKSTARQKNVAAANDAVDETAALVSQDLAAPLEARPAEPPDASTAEAIWGTAPTSSPSPVDSDCEWATAAAAPEQSQSGSSWAPPLAEAATAAVDPFDDEPEIDESQSTTWTGDHSQSGSGWAASPAGQSDSSWPASTPPASQQPLENSWSAAPAAANPSGQSWPQAPAPEMENPWVQPPAQPSWPSAEGNQPAAPEQAFATEPSASAAQFQDPNSSSTQWPQTPESDPAQPAAQEQSPWGDSSAESTNIKPISQALSSLWANEAANAEAAPMISSTTWGVQNLAVQGTLSPGANSNESAEAPDELQQPAQQEEILPEQPVASGWGQPAEQPSNWAPPPPAMPEQQISWAQAQPQAQEQPTAWAQPQPPQEPPAGASWAQPPGQQSLSSWGQRQDPAPAPGWGQPQDEQSGAGWAQPQPQPAPAPAAHEETQASPWQTTDVQTTIPPGLAAQQMSQGFWGGGQGSAHPDNNAQFQPSGSTEEAIEELNADEDSDKEKPKKRLMDFMPKLGS
ncbi:MAG TPA: hypothetical protein V6C81_06325 [Planktothrix sp.]|jgi:hypothetical protein